ncbi:hypothetical protein Peur_045252 [Populus x canadensis]
MMLKSESNMECERTNLVKSWCKIDNIMMMAVALKHYGTVMVLDAVNLYLQLILSLLESYAAADSCMIGELLFLVAAHLSGSGLYKFITSDCS